MKYWLIVGLYIFPSPPCLPFGPAISVCRDTVDWLVKSNISWIFFIFFDSRKVPKKETLPLDLHFYFTNQLYIIINFLFATFSFVEK